MRIAMGAGARHALRLPFADRRCRSCAAAIALPHARISDQKHAMKHRPIFRKRPSSRHRTMRALLVIGAILAVLGAGLASMLAP